MQTINKTDAKQLIEDSNGLIFAATFTKVDGSNRIMSARLGKKYTPTGKKQPYKPSDYNLIAAYDMRKKAFRMINLNTLIKLSINTIKYIIKQ